MQFNSCGHDSLSINVSQENLQRRSYLAGAAFRRDMVQKHVQALRAVILELVRV